MTTSDSDSDSGSQVKRIKKSRNNALKKNTKKLNLAGSMRVNRLGRELVGGHAI